MEPMHCEKCGCGGELIISVDDEYLCSDCFAEKVSKGIPDEEHHCATCGAFIDDIFAMPTEGSYYCDVCAPEAD